MPTIISPEVRKKALSHLRSHDHQEVLQMRLDLAQKLSVAEKAWRDRMTAILETGLVLSGMKFGVASIDK